MKRILLLSAATIISAALSAQTVANMNDLKPEKKAMAGTILLRTLPRREASLRVSGQKCLI